MIAERREALVVAGVPVILSLSLSIATLGSTVHWQDSGFYLAGIHDLSVLYPHGFVFYQGAAWAWSRLFGFLEISRSVFLFSSVCTAAAAGVVSLACLRFLRSRMGGVGPLAPWSASAAAALWATSFTVSSSGTLAKPYALLYLVLAIAIWSAVRVATNGSARDWTFLAAVIGLAWAAHPSAALAGPAFVILVASRPKPFGSGGLAWRSAPWIDPSTPPAAIRRSSCLRDGR
jgi:hypothetical protein